MRDRDQVGIGLVGAGWMGELHSFGYRRAIEHYPQLGVQPRLVIAADPSAERRLQATSRLGYERVTEDWREVIEHPDVVAVSVATPNDQHRDVAIAAAKAGKHIWAEKPLGRTPKETLEIHTAAAEAGVRTIVGYNYRHVPVVQHAAALIAGGRIGTVDHFRAHFLAGYARHPDGALSWRFQRAVAGMGVIGDLMSHTVDLAQYLVGPITAVSSVADVLIGERPIAAPGTGTHFSIVEDGERGPVENEDWTASLVRFEGGLHGTLEASRVITGPETRFRVEVSGTEGALAWDLERMNELDVALDAPSGASPRFTRVPAGVEHPDYAHFLPGGGLSMGYGDLKVIEAKLFLESIADGRQRSPGFREAAATATVLGAMERSVESTRWEDVVSCPVLEEVGDGSRHRAHRNHGS